MVLHKADRDCLDIGRFVLALASEGQLMIGDGLNSVDQCGHFVKWQELGSNKAVIKRDADLLVALREVEKVVNYA